MTEFSPEPMHKTKSNYNLFQS